MVSGIRMALVLGASLGLWLSLLGCAGVRPARPPAELLAQRQAHDAQMVETARAFRDRIMARLKARYDAQPGVPVVYNLLVLSGGGVWGGCPPRLVARAGATRHAGI
jgi:hypothetical protein